ncbi:MAG: J domain-containing protein [Dehalococcoidia bacterium]
MTEQDHYTVMDLTPAASDAEIKRRYRALMREVHPDANMRDPDATRKAARVNRAFETLGNPEKRRAYDVTLRARAAVATGVRARGQRASGGTYGSWVVEPGWEDVVAAQVPPKRPAHVHYPPPTIQPEEIEVDVADLRAGARVRRTITVTNTCDCTLRGDVSTSEPWLWGPIGTFEVPPGGSVTFDVEVVARKVQFPGLSRALFVTKGWAGVVPVKITGYEPKRQRPSYTTDMPYVRQRRQKWAKYR